MGVHSPEYDLVVNYCTHEWTPIDKLFTDLMDRVAPGKAIRQYETRSSNPKFQSETAKFMSGAKSILVKVVRSAALSNTIELADINGVKSVRRLVFDLAYVERINALQNSTGAVLLPTAAPVEPIPEVVSPRGDITMIFDHRNLLRDTQVRYDDSAVILEFKDFEDNRNFYARFTPTAADRLSDQLGFQAIAVRGRPNPYKLLPLPN